MVLGKEKSVKQRCTWSSFLSCAANAVLTEHDLEKPLFFWEYKHLLLKYDVDLDEDLSQVKGNCCPFKNKFF